jgi:hypothetical protein
MVVSIPRIKSAFNFFGNIIRNFYCRSQIFEFVTISKDLLFIVRYILFLFRIMVIKIWKYRLLSFLCILLLKEYHFAAFSSQKFSTSVRLLCASFDTNHLFDVRSRKRHFESLELQSGFFSDQEKTIRIWRRSLNIGHFSSASLLPTQESKCRTRVSILCRICWRNSLLWSAPPRKSSGGARRACSHKGKRFISSE